LMVKDQIKAKGAQDYPERTVPTLQPAARAASAGLRSIV
jgi:hypothetical protein